MQNEKGFTLIEMMIVLLIISILLIITVPNVAKHQATIQGKGCEAYVHLIEGQIQAYKLEFGVYPETIEDLVLKGYLPESNQACGTSKSLMINDMGEVEVVDEEPTGST